MPSYLVLKEAVNVLKSNGAFKDFQGNIVGYDHESVTYLQGTVIPEDEISPVVIALYNDNDKHTLSCLQSVEDVVEIVHSGVDSAPAEDSNPSQDDTSDKDSEPLANYDNLTVAEIVAILDESDQETVDAVKAYERINKARVTLLNYELPSSKKGEEDKGSEE